MRQKLNIRKIFPFSLVFTLVKASSSKLLNLHRTSQSIPEEGKEDTISVPLSRLSKGLGLLKSALPVSFLLEEFCAPSLILILEMVWETVSYLPPKSEVEYALPSISRFSTFSWNTKWYWEWKSEKRYLLRPLIKGSWKSHYCCLLQQVIAYVLLCLLLLPTDGNVKTNLQCSPTLCLLAQGRKRLFYFFCDLSFWICRGI